MKKIPEFLYDSELFTGLSRTAVRNIISRFKRHKIIKGRILFEQNQHARNLYIVLSGELIIETAAEKGLLDVFIARTVAGDLIGEVALLSGKIHSGRVHAALDSEVLMIGKEEFFDILKKYPLVGFNIGRIEASRLHEQIIGRRDIVPDNRFLAHITAFSNDLSHQLAMNIAVSISRATDSHVAYLHLSESKMTPAKTLKLNIRRNKMGIATKSLREYRNISMLGHIQMHATGLALLPTLQNLNPLHELQSADIPKVIASLGMQFPFVFMDFGNPDIDLKKIQKALMQADQIILGLRRNKEDVRKAVGLINSIEKFIPELKRKLRIYILEFNEVPISRLPPENKNLLQQLKSKIRPQIRIKKKPVTEIQTNSVISSRTGKSIEFNLKGEINSESNFNEPVLLTDNRELNTARLSLRSMGRWLANQSRGLALGGGGARALAEVGALRVFEEYRIHFDYISGTSMGALIGALCSCGYGSMEIEEMFAKFLPEDNAVFDYTIPIVSFFRGRKASIILKNIFGNRKIEELNTPFICVAADIISGKEVYFRQGLVWRAVLASMSLPVIFPPVRYRNYFLIDGGALNNVPGDVLKREKVNYVVGINCTPLTDDSIQNYSDITREISKIKLGRHVFKSVSHYLHSISNAVKRPPILQVAYRAMMLEGGELIKMKAHHFDCLIHMDVNEFGLFDFHRRKELIEKGILETRKNIPDIVKVLGLSGDVRKT